MIFDSKTKLTVLASLLMIVFLLSACSSKELPLPEPDAAEKLVMTTRFEVPRIAHTVRVDESAIPSALKFYQEIGFPVQDSVVDVLSYADGRQGYRVNLFVQESDLVVEQKIYDSLMYHGFWKEKYYYSVDQEVGGLFLVYEYEGADQDMAALVSNCGENFTCVVIQTIEVTGE